jgi:hypothetical protein
MKLHGAGKHSFPLNFAGETVMRMKAVYQEGKENRVARAQAQQQPLSSTPIPRLQGMATSLINLQHTHGNRFVRQLLNTGTTQQGCGCVKSSDSGGECTECREKMQNRQHDESQDEASRMPPVGYAAAAVFHPYPDENSPSTQLSKTIHKLRQTSLASPSRWVVAASILHDQKVPLEERVALASTIRGVHGQTFLTRMLSLVPAGQTLPVSMNPCEDDDCRSAVIAEEAGTEVASSDENTAQIDEHLANRLESAVDDATPLSTATRMEMESLLVANFTGVRIHADTHSAVVADVLGVNAFAIGRDIFFAPGKYQPDTAQGRWTLAHELTHVVQQEGGGTPSLETIGRRSNDAELEHEADRAATAISHGLPMLVTKHVATATLQGLNACVTREDIPENRGGIVNSGGHVSEYFEMNIDWEQPIPTTCVCSCGEYRQYIKGYFKVNGVKLKKPLWGGADLEESVYHEDGDGAGTRYGHRSDADSTGDVFTSPRATSCSYRGWDRPGVRGPAGTDVDFSLTFKGQTFDACNNTHGKINEWTVSFTGKIA